MTVETNQQTLFTKSCDIHYYVYKNSKNISEKKIGLLKLSKLCLNQFVKTII